MNASSHGVPHDVPRQHTRFEHDRSELLADHRFQLHEHLFGQETGVPRRLAVLVNESTERQAKLSRLVEGREIQVRKLVPKPRFEVCQAFRQRDL